MVYLHCSLITLKYNYSHNKQLMVFTSCRMAAIHQAALQGNAACINLLINNGAQADIKDNKGKLMIYK